MATLYPIEKSVRILNRWAKRNQESWTLAATPDREVSHCRYRVWVADFLFSPYGKYIYAETVRHALHKAAKAVEGMEPAQPKEVE